MGLLYVYLFHYLVFLHSPRHNWGIYRIVGWAFLSWYQSVSCASSSRVIAVCTSPSSLNMLPSRFSFSTGKGWWSFGDECPWHNRQKCRQVFWLMKLRTTSSYLWYFTFMWPCIVTNFFLIQPTRRTNFPNLFCHKTLLVSGSSSANHQEFSTVHSALVYVIKPAWHIPLPNVQWKTPDDWQTNCPKHVEFLDKINLGNYCVCWFY
jgi:hypothetical protein